MNACGSGHQSDGGANSIAPRKTLHRGLGGEPGSLNPAMAADSFAGEVLDDLYEGLTSESPDGAIVPGVASTWTVDDTGRVYTFELRHDAAWSDGTPIKAIDFVTAWRRVVDPKTGAPGADDLRLVTGANAILAKQAPVTELGVAAPADDRLVVTLTNPAPYFPELLTRAATFPVHPGAPPTSRGGAGWVSNGPYVLMSWIPGGTLTLRKNPHYWGRNAVAVEKVEYVPVPDETTEFRRYRAGQLDVTENVPQNALATLRSTQPQELRISPLLGTAYYAFNLHQGPLQDNRPLRQALTMAIDRRGKLAALMPFVRPTAYGFLPPETRNYAPQNWAWMNLTDSDREAEARRLYAIAGYSPKHPLHLKLLYNSSGGNKQLAVGIASMWKQILGVDTVVEEEEYRVLLESRKNPTRWDIVRLGWVADYNDAGNFLNTLRSTSPNNDAGYHNARYDALLDEASRAADPDARRHLLEQAEALMLDDYPILPLYFFSAKRLFKPYVHGAASNPLNRLYSRHLSL
jgi:oligopeptide transport system substrate-binding protein